MGVSSQLCVLFSRQLQQSRSLCAQEVWLRNSRQLSPRFSPEVFLHGVTFLSVPPNLTVEMDRELDTLLDTAHLLFRKSRRPMKKHDFLVSIFNAQCIQGISGLGTFIIQDRIYSQDGCMTIQSFASFAYVELWHFDIDLYPTPLRASVSRSRYVDCRYVVKLHKNNN